MKQVWVASDTHFDHKRIIRYCNRPFKSIRHMNQTIVRNWNRLVGINDDVIFVGDFAFGGFKRYWLNLLHGNKIMIKGNHDSLGVENLLLNASGTELLLTHNPKCVVTQGNTWVIHGHQHNSTPLIDHESKKINVSIDNTGYAPIPLSKVLELIKQGSDKATSKWQ